MGTLDISEGINWTFCLLVGWSLFVRTRFCLRPKKDSATGVFANPDCFGVAGLTAASIEIRYEGHTYLGLNTRLHAARPWLLIQGTSALRVSGLVSSERYRPQCVTELPL